SGAAAASAEEVAEPEDVAEPREDVLEAGERARVEADAALTADAGVPEAVVRGPLLRIGEHGVRLGGLLELLLGFLAALIAVRVVLEGELAVRRLQLGFRDVARDTENLVVVTLAHALATFTIAARSRRSPMR